MFSRRISIRKPRFQACLAIILSWILGVNCAPSPHLTATRITAKSFGLGNGLGGLGAGYSAGIGFGLYGGRYNSYASGFGYNPLSRPPALYAGVHPLPGAVSSYQHVYPGLQVAPVSSGFVQPLQPVHGGFVNGNHHHAQYSQFQSGYYGSSGSSGSTSGLGYNGLGSGFSAYRPNHYS